MKNSILTRRQIEIGGYLVQGMSLQDIACQLGVSVDTVRTHQKIIRKKLSASNAYQAGYQLGIFLNLEAEKLKIYL